MHLSLVRVAGVVLTVAVVAIVVALYTLPGAPAAGEMVGTLAIACFPLLALGVGLAITGKMSGW